MTDPRLFNRRATLNLLALGGVSVATLALAACSEAEGQSGGAAQASSREPAIEPEATVDIAALMEPGPLPEMIKGDPDAPVTIVEYASMTCGACGAFHNQVWPTIRERYVDTGQAKFVIREFPFDPRAAAAIMLARCAPNDGFFPMVDVLFEQQVAWARAENPIPVLRSIAKLAGFSQESFDACLKNQSVMDSVLTVRNRAADQFGVTGTPTFFINGDKHSGNMSVEEMSKLIDSHL